MNIDYIAGFFDGEGCVNISFAKKERKKMKGVCNFTFHVNPKISILMGEEPSNLTVLKGIQKFLGMGHIYSRTRRERHGQREVVFRIYRRDDLKKFIKLIKDKVIVKRAQILKLQKILELMKNIQENIVEILQIANELNPRRTNPRKWTVQYLKNICPNLF